MTFGSVSTELLRSNIECYWGVGTESD
jgi:hypothetical protein